MVVRLRQGVIVCEGIWPSLGRTVYGDHQRYLRTYMNDYKGTYFFGDSASRDADGHYWIQGRCDGAWRMAAIARRSLWPQRPGCAHGRTACPP